MDEDDARATIFKVGNKFYVYTGTEHTWGARSTAKDESIEEVEWFSPLIRDEESESSTKLYIVPVAMNNIDVWELTDNWFFSQDSKSLTRLDGYKSMLLASKAGDSSEKASTYVTVEDAMNGSEDIPDTEEEYSDDEKMQVYFATKYVVDWDDKKIVSHSSADTKHAIAPLLFTDYRQHASLANPSGFKITASMSLLEKTSSSMGNSHESLAVDSRHKYTIKFVCDEMPDSKSIFIFHNKRFLCEKVEMTIQDDGIDRVKTGYFYEIL